MYPISDLTAFCRRTLGDVPPKLVGASTTVVGSKMYLYGGRLVAERKMVSDIYVFDLETFKWERVEQVDENVPQARYFHSADTWNNHLIVFGGMAIQPLSDNPEDLCVLNDVRMFDLTTNRWLPSSETSPPPLVPKARYAHLSSVTSNRLFVIGGQDLNNVWLDDVHVYDLATQTWVQRRDYPRHCGTYRSVAVTSTKRVRLPQEEGRRATALGQPGTRFSIDKNTPSTADVTQSESLIHLPYSTEPTDDFPCDIFLFSNYNFTDVQRELEVFSPLPGSDFTVSDRSTSMTGAFFPPGLRFPTGAILGTHFIVAGTYLSQTFQSYSIWALDLVSMTWTRIDPGSTLSSSSGSWFRSCLWPEANKFLVFGNRHGNLVEDYNRRLLSWDHVICIDMEAFGVYQPPPLLLDLPQQELGLAALEEGVLADFEIVCDDGRRVKCSRKLLEDRWPWFKDQRNLFLEAAAHALETIPGSTAPGASQPLPDVHAASDEGQVRPDPRLTPRALNLSEPYPVTLAFLQYLYSMSLITPLQHAPAVLSQLLLISSTYEMPHLQGLVKHAMHRALSFATSVGIYGVATLCNCRSLQIRALRVVMAYSQKRPNPQRPRGDRDGSGGSGSGRPNDPNGGAGAGGPPGAGPGAFDRNYAARPRGMSDASYMHGPSELAGRAFANGTVDLRPVVSEADLAQMLALLPTGPFHVADHRRNQSNNSTCSTTTITASNTSSPASTLSSAPSPAMDSPLDQPPRPSTSTMEMRRPGMHTSHSMPIVPTLRAQTPQPLIAPAPIVPYTQHPLTTKHSRRSIVSMATEQEILDLAGILSPAVDSRQIDTPLDRAWAASPSTLRHKISVESNAPSLASVSTVSTQSIDTSEYGDSLYLSATSASTSSHSPYHLLSRRRYTSSDTPSLAASGSDSHSTVSLSTPPLSRAPSFHQSTSTSMSTPPLSPSSTSTSSPATPLDLSISSLGLDVIHENRRSEDDGGAVSPSPSATPYGRTSINTTRTTTSTGTGTSGSTGTSASASTSTHTTSSSKRSDGAKSKESASTGSGTGSSRSSSSKDREHKSSSSSTSKDKSEREKTKKLNAAFTQSAAIGPFMMSNDMSWLTLGPEELAKLGIHPHIPGEDDGPVGADKDRDGGKHKRSAFGRLFHKGVKE